jgi:hypothetical protein
VTAAAAPGGGGGERARLGRLLAELERVVAAELGDEEATAQAREYLEHHEFALALELLVCVAMRAGLDPAGHEAGVEEAAGRMGLVDSEPLAEWRRYSGGRGTA